MSWFLSSEDGGLTLAVKAMKMHCSCAQQFVDFCNVVCLVTAQV